MHILYNALATQYSKAVAVTRFWNRFWNFRTGSLFLGTGSYVKPLPHGSSRVFHCMSRKISGLHMLRSIAEDEPVAW